MWLYSSFECDIGSSSVLLVFPLKFWCVTDYEPIAHTNQDNCHEVWLTPGRERNLEVRKKGKNRFHAAFWVLIGKVISTYIKKNKEKAGP